MLHDKSASPETSQKTSPRGDSGLLSVGREVADRFKDAAERAGDFLRSLATGSKTSTVDLEAVNRTVTEAAPYLGATETGVIFYKSELTSAAVRIQRALYEIPPSTGPTDFEQRVMPHHKLIEDTVWKPLIGKDLLSAVQDHFKREGIHCHTPEALKKESEYFVEAITRGDTARFSEFLMWCLKDDPKMVNKLNARLG